jgi:Pin2-interacting protein X1
MKLSHDPNNTKWTNDTQSFGHKIMASQGWQPGDYLGVKDAPHAEFHTAANASHIRVSIKDDNLGLGAKIGSGVGHGECTGLDAFTNLLGRLNGKDEEELEREQKSREDLKRAIYTERRWGSVRFVPGGFLIGDKIQHLIDSEAERIRRLAAGSSDVSSDSSSSSESEDDATAVVEKPKKSKRRKIEVLEAEPEVVAIKVKKSKKKKRKSGATFEDAEEVAAAMEGVKISKRESKKDRKNREVEGSEDDTEMKKLKKEKKSKKDRKAKKEKAASDVEMVEKQPRKKKKSKRDKNSILEEGVESLGSSQTTTKESTPSTPLTIESGRSTPLMQGRHAVRARNIAQKRLAHMDVASLNQVIPTCTLQSFKLISDRYL